MDGAYPPSPTLARPSAPPPGVSVTRIGTQVVVRLSGVVDDRSADRLGAAVDEVAALALHRVVVDLDDVDGLDGAGLTFLAELAERWTLRVLNSPPGLRRQLATDSGRAS